MVRKQCFEVGCLGAQRVCSEVWGCFSGWPWLRAVSFVVSGERKKGKKEFKPVFQVPTSHKIHQCACICCLDCGGEDTTTRIKLPSRPQTSVLGYRPEWCQSLFHLQNKGPIYFLSGGPESVFFQRHFATLSSVFSQSHLSRVWVWPPGLCFSSSCRLQELVWGDWVWSCSILLHCLLGMGRMKGFIQEHRQVLSHTLQWVGTCLNQQPDVGAASLLLLGLEDEAQLPTPMLYVGWGGRERGKAVRTRLTISCMEKSQTSRRTSCV